PPGPLLPFTVFLFAIHRCGKIPAGLSPSLPLRLPSRHRSRGSPDAHRVFGEGGGVRAGRAAVARSSQPMAKTRAPKTEPDREAARDDRYRGESAGGARLPRHQQTEKARTTRPASRLLILSLSKERSVP